MDMSEKADDVVLRRMIRDAERAYERLDKPKFFRVTMGNDPKMAGIDCSGFQPAETNQTGNICHFDEFERKYGKAKSMYKNFPHCNWK